MPPHESLTVTNSESLYIPDAALVRSGVYLEGTASLTVPKETLPDPESFDTLTEAVGNVDETAVPALYDPLIEQVSVAETRDATAADLTAKGGVLRGANRDFPASLRFTSLEKHDDEIHVEATWRAELIVIHPVLWSASDVVNRAIEAVSGYDEITHRECQASEIGVGFAPPGWKAVTPPEDNRHDDIEAAWMHESLLYLVAVGYAENDTNTMWTVTELGAAVPNPHPDLVVTGYSQRGAAHSDAERLMLSISGAHEAEPTDATGTDPVAAAHDRFEYRGTRVRLDNAEVADPSFTTDAKLLESLPAKPVTRSEFHDDIQDAMQQMHGEDATFLLPEEAVVHDGSVSDAIDTADAPMSDLITAFTVVGAGADTITVYGLEETAAGGMGWYKHTGAFNAFTPDGDPPGADGVDVDAA